MEHIHVVKEFLYNFFTVQLVWLVHTYEDTKKHSKATTYHVSKDIIWFLLEHLIEKLLDLFWYFILVEISHSFALLLQAVCTVFDRHFESPRQLQLFTADSFSCTSKCWFPVPSYPQFRWFWCFLVFPLVNSV